MGIGLRTRSGQTHALHCETFDSCLTWLGALQDILDIRDFSVLKNRSRLPYPTRKESDSSLGQSQTIDEILNSTDDIVEDVQKLLGADSKPPPRAALVGNDIIHKRSVSNP